MIEIKITANNPLEALANVTAYGILCMENREVFDAAGIILDTVRRKQSKTEPASEDPVPPTTPPAPPSTVPTAPISQSPAKSAGAASPGLTPPSDPAPVTGVPVAAAPTYTLEQISKAGADLISDASKLPALQALLQQFGVAAVTQLDPSQYGAFVTALRGLGAKI